MFEKTKNKRGHGIAHFKKGERETKGKRKMYLEWTEKQSEFETLRVENKSLSKKCNMERRYRNGKMKIVVDVVDYCIRIVKTLMSV